MPAPGGLRAPIRLLTSLALVASLAACGPDDAVVERAGGASPLAADAAVEPATTQAPVVTTEPQVPATTAPPPTTTPPVTTGPPPPPTTVPMPRVLVDTGFGPFALAEQLTLFHPAAQVERIGFHEAGHDGARQMEPTVDAARPITLESRNRGTGSQTAADIVVAPDAEIRAPVTGTVRRAGGYILYCDHHDDYAVIEPDARPGWEVKLLHIDGVQVQAGQRVEAGVTVIAPRPTVLPFGSQVDDHTAEPSWPHVHIEVVDPSIPDKPNPGGGGGC